MKIQFEGYQFFSRKILEDQLLNGGNQIPLNLRERPEIGFTLHGEVRKRQSPINFATLSPTRPSVGAFEGPLNQKVDVYMSRRWPQYLILYGDITIPEEEFTNELSVYWLYQIHNLLWGPNVPWVQFLMLPDQLARIGGYRREYFNKRIDDFDRRPRPGGPGHFIQTHVGHPIGPGFCRLDLPQFNVLDEYVWSQILPFSGATTFQNDKRDIIKKIKAIKLHENSYSELKKTHDWLKKGEVEAAARWAANAVDAILRYYCKAWDVEFPDERGLSFADRIEEALRGAFKPSYRQADPTTLQTIEYCYKARNKSHEADCYYTDNVGKRVDVKTIAQAEEFVEAVERFVMWIDALP